MYSIRTLSIAQTRQGLLRADLQSIGLMLVIIMSASMPLFSAAKSSQKQIPDRRTAAPAASIKIASAKTGIADGVTPGISDRTKACGDPNSKTVR